MEDKKPTTWQIVIGSYTIILACLAFFLASKFNQIDKTSETVGQILVENKVMQTKLENVEERIKSLQEIIIKKNENFTVSNFQKSKNDLRFCLDSSRIHNTNFIAQNSSSIRRFW